MARTRGFTLLEILVVIVIIGVMVSMVSLSVGVLGADREVEDETRRFWAVVRQAREEAELQAIDVAIFVGLAIHAEQADRQRHHRNHHADDHEDDENLEQRETVLRMRPGARGMHGYSVCQLPRSAFTPSPPSWPSAPSV